MSSRSRNLKGHKLAEHLERASAEGFIARAMASRSDGYTFYLTQGVEWQTKPRYQYNVSQYRVTAGCRRNRTFKWWRHHLEGYYKIGKRAETRRILDLFEQQIKCRWC